MKKVGCPHFLAGFCGDGPQCSLAHPQWKCPNVPAARRNRDRDQLPSAAGRRWAPYATTGPGGQRPQHPQHPQQQQQQQQQQPWLAFQVPMAPPAKLPNRPTPDRFAIRAG